MQKNKKIYKWNLNRTEPSMGQTTKLRDLLLLISASNLLVWLGWGETE